VDNLSKSAGIQKRVKK